MMTAQNHTERVSRAPTDRGHNTNPTLDPEEVRAGEVALKSPRQRWIYFAAVVGAIILAGVITLTVY